MIIQAMPYPAAGYGTPTLPSLSFIADVTHYWDVNQRVTLVNTNEVSKWADLIGAVEFNCTSTSTRPLFSSTAINSNPGIDCASVGRALTAPYTDTDGVITFIIVVALANLGPSGGCILSVGNDVAYASDQAQLQTLSLRRGTTSASAEVWRNTRTFSATFGSYAAAKVVMIQLNGTDTRMFINNSQAGTNTLAQNGALNPTHFGIFQEISSGTKENAQGYVGDMLVVNRALTSTEKTELHTFFTSKFGT